jgi:UDP-N-acetylmuramate--alanine ligase
MIAIVTNIDNDHLGTHGGDFGKLCQSFVSFLHNLPFYGLAVLCNDDENVRRILPDVGRPFVTYGVDEGADIRAIDIVRDRHRTAFKVLRPGHSLPLEIVLNLPGMHSVRNALAAIAVASELQIDDAAIARALEQFQGIDRRMQLVAQLQTPVGDVVIVDDYGHHPTELAATMEALRQAWPERRLVLVFQPHRYSRTRDLLDDFGRVLCTADVLLVTEVYAAGEAPIEGADGRAICRVVRSRGLVEPVFVDAPENIAESLATLLRDGDLVVTMGAGHIGNLAHELPEQLQSLLKHRESAQPRRRASDKS